MVDQKRLIRYSDIESCESNHTDLTVPPPTSVLRWGRRSETRDPAPLRSFLRRGTLRLRNQGRLSGVGALRDPTTYDHGKGWQLVRVRVSRDTDRGPDSIGPFPVRDRHLRWDNHRSIFPCATITGYQRSRNENLCP